MSERGGRCVLYGCKGAGSAVVEALLELLGLDYETREVAPWDGGAPLEELKRHNPLGQVPTLLLPDGRVLTESAAIIFALLDRHPDAGLMPERGTPARDALYRWVCFLAANIYAAISVGDAPERWVSDASAREELKQRSIERTRAYWGMLEESLAPAPYLLGDKLTALDVYVAVLSHWRPGRAWFDGACPKLAAAARIAEAHPILARVFSRNFG